MYTYIDTNPPGGGFSFPDCRALSKEGNVIASTAQPCLSLTRTSENAPKIITKSLKTVILSPHWLLKHLRSFKNIVAYPPA